MALIRAEYAIDYRDKATTLNLSDVAQDAQRLKQDAQAQAERTIAEAHAERERLIADASEVGHKQGYDAGYAEGHANGLEQGKQAAEEDWHNKIQVLAVAWGDALTTLEQQRRAVVHSLESDALRLVADIATRVARRAVALNHSETTARSLNDAIARIDHATRVTIQVHPDDLAATEGGMGAIAELLLGSPDLRLKPNDTIAPGSIIVESDAARIDASIEGAIDSLVSAILPDKTRLPDRIDTTLETPSQTAAQPTNSEPSSTTPTTDTQSSSSDTEDDPTDDTESTPEPGA